MWVVMESVKSTDFLHWILDKEVQDECYRVSKYDVSAKLHNKVHRTEVWERRNGRISNYHEDRVHVVRPIREFRQNRKDLVREEATNRSRHVRVDVGEEQSKNR